MSSLIPKRIKLIVNKGQDLLLNNPNKIIKNRPRKWRVLFLGVVEKMATAKVESDSGNPEWLCEITVTCKNAEEPISMLVTDSKGHHIGQVVIPLISIPPKPVTDNQQNGRPPLLLSNLYKSELEPTKKNSHPHGYLYYWMWTEDYWKFEDINKLKIKKSLSRSMQNISNSTLNLFRRKKSNASNAESQMSNGGNPFESYSETGLKSSPVKVNQLKILKHKSGSDTSASTYNSQMPYYSGTTPNSPISNGYHVNDNYHASNPFDGLATMDISIENNVTQPEKFDSNSNAALSHQTSICSKESPVSNKKRYGLFNKFRAKKSKSSLDLNKMATESENRIPPILPQSLGKHQGIRLFEKKNEISKSSSDISSWFCGDTQLQESKMKSGTYSSNRGNRPQSCMIQSNNENYLPTTESSTNNNYSEFKEDNRNVYNNHINLNRNFSLNSSAYTVGLSANNNYDEMSRRELVEKINFLEKELKDFSVKCRLSDQEVIKLRNEKKALHDELSTVRDELCKLKCSLLEAGETKYLEKSRADEILDLTSWRANSKI